MNMRRSPLAAASLGTIVALLITAAPRVPEAAVSAHDVPAGPTSGAGCLPVNDSTSYEQTVAGVGQVALTVTNYGFIGTNYLGRGPSFEYPYSTGSGPHIDHLVRGGLWIGGVNLLSDSTRVSTATLDGQYNSRSSTGTEYTPREYLSRDDQGAQVYVPFRKLSTLPNDPHFDPVNAISEQDISTRYTDYPAQRCGAGEAHSPLVATGIQVSQRSLSWSFEPSNKYVLLEFKIVNPSLEALSNLFVGIYSELLSVDKSQFVQFPPGGSELFSMKDIAYVDSLHMVEEHHFRSGQGGPYSWDGIKLLGASWSAARDTLDELGRPYKREVTFHWFTYFPADTTRGTDAKRLAIMADSVITSTDRDEALDQCERPGIDNPTTCDPVEVLAHGPYSLGPGDTLTVAFGFVGGDDETNLQANARAAQRAWDLGYRVPVPPPSPGLRVAPGLGTLTLHWEDSPERFRDKSRSDIEEEQRDFEGYRVYISEDGLHYNLLREADKKDSLGYNTGMDALLDPNPVLHDSSTVIDPETGVATQHVRFTKYAHTISGLKTGFRYWVAVTAYDIGDPAHNVGVLESGVTQNGVIAVPGPPPGPNLPKPVVFPNPYKGSAVWDGSYSRDKLIWFANLPRRSTIRIYTLPGDLVETIEFDAATYHGENARLLVGQSGRTGGPPPTLSGTMCAWNMISASEQEVASGLYIFSVTDRDGGAVSTGHFLVVK